MTPPTIVSTDPANNGTAFAGRQTLTINFSEPLATASTAPANFQLVEAGSDSIFGSGDDVAIPITNVQFQNNDSQIILTTSRLPVGSY